MAETPALTNDQLIHLQESIEDLSTESVIRHKEISAQLCDILEQMGNMSEAISAIHEQQVILEDKLDQTLAKEGSEDCFEKLQNPTNQVDDTEAVKKTFESNNVVKLLNQLNSDDLSNELNDNVKDDKSAQEGAGYVNWSKNHDKLSHHAYVPVTDFTHYIHQLARLSHVHQMHDTSVNKLKLVALLKTPFVAKVNSRFPADNLYLNLNLPIVRYYLTPIMASLSENQRVVPALCNKLLTTIDTIIFDELDGIYDRRNFEENFKLNWVEPRCERLAVEQVNEKGDEFAVALPANVKG